MKYPKHLIKLIEALRLLPGVGNKTAERYAFQMLGWQPHHLRDLSAAIATLKEKSSFCTICGALSDEEGCPFCNNERRDRTMICVVATIREIFAVEQMGEYRGLYHVLGGLLSPMEGITPEALAIETLLSRAKENAIEEVVIALDSTLEGDATALYLSQQLEKNPVKVSRLAFGIPMGSSLDYIDGGTLAMALSGRRAMR